MPWDTGTDVFEASPPSVTGVVHFQLDRQLLAHLRLRIGSLSDMCTLHNSVHQHGRDSHTACVVALGMSRPQVIAYRPSSAGLLGATVVSTGERK